MEFKQLTPKEMQILLKAFDIDLDIEYKQCHYCSSHLVLEKTGFLPPPNPNDKNRNYILICDSPLCMVEYIGELEENGENPITAKGKICPDCLGEGKWHNKRCEKCKGKGRL